MPAAQMDRPPPLTLQNTLPSPQQDLPHSLHQKAHPEILSDPETTEHDSDLSSYSLPTTPTSSASTHSHDHDQDHDHDHDRDDDEDHDLDADEESEILTKIHAKLAQIQSIYDAGKPLFPRQLLGKLDQQIDAGEQEVQIQDLDGVNHAYSLVVPGWCADFATSYRIAYNSIQNLTCIHPSFPEISLRDTSPVSICYTSSPEYFPKAAYEDVEAAFDRNQKKWAESQTCATLVQNLKDLMKDGRLGRGKVRKIVGFGLGSLAAIEEETGGNASGRGHGGKVGLGDGYHCVRAHAQHAAIMTIAQTLLTKWNAATSASENDNRVNEEYLIEIYVQDPAYTPIDHTLLEKINIKPLEDPKGFLEIDSSTLVFSVSPNVPVKQVVADVCWPAAMIWNTVSLEEKESQWEKKVRDGEEFWVVPFTTDPDSTRVRDMVTGYTSVALKDSDEFFGDLTIYAR
ncbi:hypothetical protein BJY04DRAFT_41217 [Aspergillus karnatakaensis]|uniref:SRR1 family protein n=1 Tax=Aspergillus karnatakaensis TaxID=1810916 RepID=UPI003CCCDDC2